MEYGIRSRVHDASPSGGGGVVPNPTGNSWLDSAAAAAAAAYSNNSALAAAYHQLPSGALPALLLNSLHALQTNAAAAALELCWKPGKREPPDIDEEEEEEEDEEDEDGGSSSTGNGEQQQEEQQQQTKRRRTSRRREQESEGEEGRGDGEAGAAGEERDEEEDEEGNGSEGGGSEEENDGSAESWKDTPMPILSSWMLGAYTSMLGRLSAATAALEAADVGSNLTSDSESESDRSSYTDMLSRESSPSGSGHVRQQSYPRATPNPSLPTRTKKKRTSDSCAGRRVKSRPAVTSVNGNDSAKEASAEAAATTDGSATSSSSSQGNKKRALALQRVRYEREEYRCSLCSYACTIEKAFQRHLRAHARGTANESRVSCAVCGADRSSEVDLSKHMRRHRDNRYFCCDICIFRTVQLKKLIQHRRMHTGEKPHLCPHCAYRSARRDNLRSHVRRVHKKENLYCDTFSPRGMFIAPKLHPQLNLDEQQQQDQDGDREYSVEPCADASEHSEHSEPPSLSPSPTVQQRQSPDP